MPGFVQFVEFQAKDVEGLKDALVQFRTEHPETTTAVLERTGRGPGPTGQLVAINVFESYEKAMEQSNNLLVTEFSQSFAERMEGRSFRNLDVLYEL